ncbi:MAG: 1,6-anhydro-N-acetylmuramyl-L-alanine amidase AmpD [Pseudohongiellaceae bacterium]
MRNNWLEPVDRIESPNQSDRSADFPVDLLVIHNISLPPGEYGTGCIDQLFCNRLDAKRHSSFQELAKLRVSAHLLIDRLGRLTQFVPFNRKAWHAGNSSFHDRENCNDFSIGIELEGTDFQEFTDNQYLNLDIVSRLLMREYPMISIDRIVGHCDIAPGRKTDPGPFFDWRRLRQGLLQPQLEEHYE